MRIQYWPAMVCGWMTAAMFGHTVLAQNPADEVSGVYRADADDDDADGDSSDLGILPERTQPIQYAQNGAYGGSAGNFMVPGQGYYSPEMPPPNAWPETSPYENRIDTTFNEGGQWNNYTDNNFAKKYYFSLEYLYGHGNRPGENFIGDPAQSSVGAFPAADGVTNIFPANGIYNTTGFLPQIFHNGMKARYGFENPDGSGAELSGFVLFQNSLSFLQTAAQQGTPIAPLAGIVVNSGNGAGVVLPFDSQFYTQSTQQIFGADADFFLAPFFERNTFKLRFMYGAKYLQIHEDFLVQGQDSGQGYTVTNPSTAGGGGGVGGTTGSTLITGPFTQLTSPYTTTIDSATTNNLIGPMLGVRYDLGGDKLKIWGVTKFGAMADIEKMTVSSANVGQYKTLADISLTPNVLAGPASLGLQNPGTTTHTRTNLHISPLIDTSINGDIPIFSLIPYVNQWPVFKYATFRVGYNFVYVGEIARAPGIINYNLLDPTIHSARQQFSYNWVNFGVNWKY